MLERLLEDDCIDFDGISATSVGAVNAVMQAMSVGSMLKADWDLVNKLVKVGRERAGAWIAGNFDRLGKQSTTDIHDKYL